MRNVFIIGGTSGIGWSLAQLYLSKGYRVGIASREVNKAGIDFSGIANLSVYTLDVVDAEMVQQILQQFSFNTTLDILINCAGSYIDSALHEISLEEANQMLQTNIKGTIHTFDAATKLMQSGTVIQNIAVIASISALMDYPKATIYSKSKRAVLTICDAYRRTLLSEGVAVSCICPGYVATDKLYALNQDDLSKKQYVISPAESAQIIFKGIEHRLPLIVFPSKMYRLIKILNILPTWLLQKIMYKKAIWQNKK